MSARYRQLQAVTDVGGVKILRLSIGMLLLIQGIASSSNFSR